MTLESKLEAYRNLTFQLIDRVKTDGDLEELFDKRQQIIAELKTMSFTKEEFREIYYNFDIANLEDKLNYIIKEEKIEVKKKIRHLKISQQAKNQYNNNQITPNFFSKKI